MDRRSQIIEIARRRFRKTGLAETTLEMVAEDAGIARPNLYRYFKHKSDLLSAVLVIEAEAINEQRRSKIADTKNFADRLVRSIQATVEIVGEDPFWADIVSPENVPYTAYVATSDPIVLDSNMSYWEPILDDAEENGELATGLDHDEVRQWLLGIEFMFMERREIFPTPDTVAHFAKTFVLPALIRRD
ncbi:MAG: hypothetical protein Pars2KO_20490 [Parasphingorhabdus sp.]